MRAATYHRSYWIDAGTAGDVLAALRRYVELRGWELVAEHADAGLRPQLQGPHAGTLFDLVEAGELDVVVLQDLDRLFRSSRDLALRVDAWRERGIHLVVTGGGDEGSQPIDTTLDWDAARFDAGIRLFRGFERLRHRRRTAEGTVRSAVHRAGTWGAAKTRPAVSDLEIKRLWETEGLSQNKVVARLKRAGAKCSKGWINKRIRELVGEGFLDPARRASHG